MSGIINWLRGEDKIVIMTLLQEESNDILPKIFAKRPNMAQWVLSYSSQGVIDAVQQLVSSVVKEFDVDQRSDKYDIDVTQNDTVRDLTPDCSLVVDISDKDYGVLFRVYLTNFVKQWQRWLEVMGYRSHGYLAFPTAFLGLYKQMCPKTPLDEWDSVSENSGYTLLEFSEWKWYSSSGGVAELEAFMEKLDMLYDTYEFSNPEETGHWVDLGEGLSRGMNKDPN